MNDNIPGGIILFGATGGIGSATARRLVREGRSVLLAARNQEKLDQLAQELGAPVVIVNADDSGSIEAAFASCANQFGSVSGAVNCFGSLLLKPAHLTTDADWQQTLTTHLFSSFAIVRAAAKTMRQGGGSIVLISSAAARIGLANHEAIAAAKAGIQGLALSAAATYASKGIRINTVAPGLVRTPLTEKIWSAPASESASAQMHALGRLGEPDEVASLICWLLSPEQTWVTGQIFGIDGGLGTIAPRPRSSV